LNTHSLPHPLFDLLIQPIQIIELILEEPFQILHRLAFRGHRVELFRPAVYFGLVGVDFGLDLGEVFEDFEGLCADL
jgi:hypothetical protein